MNVGQDTKHAACARQVERGREENTHARQRLIETGKQTRNVREGDQGYY